MAIPKLGDSSTNALIFNNSAYQAPAHYYAGNTTGSVPSSATVPSGSDNASAVGGQAGMYAQAAQLAFNAVYGAIVKPKAANLQAAQIKSNAKLEYAAEQFNIAQMRKYEKKLTESALLSYLDSVDMAKSFVGTQKVAMSASGIWSGSTFDAFVEDTVYKTEQEISARAGEVSSISANIRFQADMLEIGSKVRYEMAKANAKGVSDAGRASGIMSLFGL